MKIQAAVLWEKNGALKIEEIDIADPVGKQVMVKISAVGVCHTDEAGRTLDFTGPTPLVLGHEGSGVVAKVGPEVKHLKEGDHVVMTYPYCGECPNCKAGKTYACHRSVSTCFTGKLDDGSTTLSKDGKTIYTFFGQGSFATYAIANGADVVKVDDSVDLDYLGPIGCGVQTGAGAVINGLNAEKGSSLAVYGCGSVGLSAIMGGVIAGCGKIIAVGGSPNKLELAKELGATHTVNRRETPDVNAEIRKLTDGLGVDYAVDTTGVPDIISEAVLVLAPGGGLAVLAIGPAASIDVQDMSGKASRIVGVAEGNKDARVQIPELVDYYKKGKLPLERIITFYDFKDINQAFEDVHAGKTIKPVVRMPK
jgi:aryl-alcohol dehydrogenase